MNRKPPQPSDFDDEPTDPAGDWESLVQEAGGDEPAEEDSPPDEEGDEEELFSESILGRVCATVKGGGRVVMGRSAFMLLRTVGARMIVDFENGLRAELEFETDNDANRYAEVLSTESLSASDADQPPTDPGHDLPS